MNQALIQNAIDEYIVAHSGFEKSRNYLSISHVVGCPRQAVREYKHGFPVSHNTHRMAFAGYQHEASIREILVNRGLITQINVEVVAPFDDRLRGHLDAVSGINVLEIKSLSSRRWEKLLQQSPKAFHEHYAQCQLYMLYGGFKFAFVIYRNRESYEHRVCSFPFKETAALDFEQKAKLILRAIDQGESLVCSCGYCKD